MPSLEDMTATPYPQDDRLAPAPALRILRQLGHDTLFILIGFPLGLIAVVVGVTGLGLGLGLAVVWIGVPLLMGVLLLARGLATVERARIAPVIGRAMPHPYYKRPATPTLWRRVFTPITDVQSWLDLLHAIFRFIRQHRRVQLRGDLVGGGAGRSDLPALGLVASRTARTTSTCPNCSAWATRCPPGSIFYLIVGAFFALTLPRWSAAARSSRRGSPGPCSPASPSCASRSPRLTAARDGAGADGGRRLGRGDRAAPARARHPRRPAAAAGPARDGPRPGPAAARHRPGGRPRHGRRGAGPDPRDAGRAARALARHRAADPGRPRAGRGRWPRSPGAAPCRSSWTSPPSSAPTGPGSTRPWRTPPTSWSPRR